MGGEKKKRFPEEKCRSWRSRKGSVMGPSEQASGKGSLGKKKGKRGKEGRRPIIPVLRHQRGRGEGNLKGREKKSAAVFHLHSSGPQGGKERKGKKGKRSGIGPTPFLFTDGKGKEGGGGGEEYMVSLLSKGGGRGGGERQWILFPSSWRKRGKEKPEGGEGEKEKKSGLETISGPPGQEPSKGGGGLLPRLSPFFHGGFAPEEGGGKDQKKRGKGERPHADFLSQGRGGGKKKKRWKKKGGGREKNRMGPTPLLSREKKLEKEKRRKKGYALLSPKPGT